MASVPDRLALNAHIEALIESRGHDQAARNAIAAFGRSLTPASRFEFNAHLPQSGTGVAGHTPQHGTVQIDNDRPDEREISIGRPKERVGYYKIWREPHKQWISISHFWKSDLETGSETELAREWALALDDDGEPLWFAERGFRTIWSLRLFGGLTLTIDREIYVEIWGKSEGCEHKGGLQLGLIYG